MNSTAAATGAPRVVVVGAGPLAAEVVRNLGLAGIPSATHSPQDFWTTLRLADLQECYSAVAAGVDPGTRRRVSALAQLAAVNFVSVWLDADGITLETYPFGHDADCACCECRGSEAPGDTIAAAPDPISTNIAGALAAAAALQWAEAGARRLSIPAPVGASTSTPLERSADCPACSPPWRAPQVIRTRNRWLAQAALTQATTALDDQPVRLSDAIVTACECPACGPADALTRLINRPVADLAAAPPACPNCGATTLRVEARDEFSLGELMARFGSAPVPAKFALARIGTAAVCFDLQGATGREPGTA